MIRVSVQAPRPSWNEPDTSGWVTGFRYVSNVPPAAIGPQFAPGHGPLGLTQDESRAALLKIYGFAALAVVIVGGSVLGYLAVKNRKSWMGLRGARVGVRPPGVPLPKGSKRRR